MSMKKSTSVVLLNAVMVVVSLIFVFPLFWAVSLSFMTEAETISYPPVLVSSAPHIGHYMTILTTSDTPVFTWFFNSAAAAFTYASLSVIICTLAAYALARLNFRFRDLYFKLILLTMTVPALMLLIPNYTMVSDLGFTDSLLAIIIPGLGGTAGVFLLRQFFVGIPKDLEEAAVIDGAGPLARLWLVILPLGREAVITLWVMNFMNNWNDYIWPLVVLYSPETRTMPVGMATLNGPYVALYGPLMAGAVLLAIPSIVIFMFVKKYYLKGISISGAIKE